MVDNLALQLASLQIFANGGRSRKIKEVGGRKDTKSEASGREGEKNASFCVAGVLIWSWTAIMSLIFVCLLGPGIMFLDNFSCC